MAQIATTITPKHLLNLNFILMLKWIKQLFCRHKYIQKQYLVKELAYNYAVGSFYTICSSSFCNHNLCRVKDYLECTKCKKTKI